MPRPSAVAGTAPYNGTVVDLRSQCDAGPELVVRMNADLETSAVAVRRVSIRSVDQRDGTDEPPANWPSRALGSLFTKIGYRPELPVLKGLGSLWGRDEISSEGPVREVIVLTSFGETGAPSSEVLLVWTASTSYGVL